MRDRGVLLPSVVLLTAFAAAALICSPAAAEKRVAIVIGNSDYRYTPRLKNPSNDAEDIAAALGRVGFDVVRGIDIDYSAMRERIRIFAVRLARADVGVFFYAGHGLQVAGKNYLIPVDARLASPSDHLVAGQTRTGGME